MKIKYFMIVIIIASFLSARGIFICLHNLRVNDLTYEIVTSSKYNELSYKRLYRGCESPLVSTMFALHKWTSRQLARDVVIYDMCVQIRNEIDKQEMKKMIKLKGEK